MYQFLIVALNLKKVHKDGTMQNLGQLHQHVEDKVPEGWSVLFVTPIPGGVLVTLHKDPPAFVIRLKEKPTNVSD